MAKGGKQGKSKSDSKENNAVSSALNSLDHLIFVANQQSALLVYQ